MAKYVSAVGWICSANGDLSRRIDDLENFVLGKYAKTSIPEDVAAEIRKAQELMNKAQAHLTNASRALIEDDAVNFEPED